MSLSILNIPSAIILMAVFCSGCNVKEPTIFKPDCAFAAEAVIKMVKDRDASLIAKVRKISEIEIIEDLPEKFTCRGKGIFSDGKIAPILVKAHLQNGVWYFQSEQGSHLK
ncbi:MAG: hypothetical protein COA43_05615 [Robiginitomaculum sp.]|nr:MAG: hypothetical protein COA43_05615 [Robiginitomaculum sp.]